jgi:hypothetical protein
MIKKILLRQFEYSIPPCVNTIAGIKQNHIVDEDLPLIKVVIDFENGNLKLEGDWHFMMSSNKYNEASCFNNHKERVKVETTIYASSPINLNATDKNGWIFPLDGTIKDADYLAACSGLLILDTVPSSAEQTGSQWNISLYLYDQQFDDCEIKFKWPLYTTTSNENRN